VGKVAEVVLACRGKRNNKSEHVITIILIRQGATCHMSRCLIFKIPYYKLNLTSHGYKECNLPGFRG
jgi:hypothetical protein